MNGIWGVFPQQNDVQKISSDNMSVSFCSLGFIQSS